MPTLIVLFNLKEGQNAEASKRWANEKETPAIKPLLSVEDKRVYRATGLMGTDAPLPYQYVEIIEVNDLAQLRAQTGTGEVQQLVQQFRQITQDLLFIVTEQFS